MTRKPVIRCETIDLEPTLEELAWLVEAAKLFTDVILMSDASDGAKRDAVSRRDALGEKLETLAARQAIVEEMYGS